MSTIMTRSAALFWWKKELPREIAYLERNSPYEKWEPITYHEIIKKKTDRMISLTNHKRRTESIVPCFIWVFYNDTFLFHGWYIYIKTLKKDYALNWKRTWKSHNEELIIKIMHLFPCDVLPIDDVSWMKAFANRYHHVGFHRTVQGLAKCWCKIDRDGELVDVFLNSPSPPG
jgi:hypothetical protein